MVGYWYRAVGALILVGCVQYIEGVCELPSCYDKYREIPGDTPPSDTPQMVIFTYSGVLTTKVRNSITNMFPDKRKNPNNCPIGITLFVVSQGSDDCSIHKLYVRGHEIALSGLNRSTQVDGWGVDKWTDSIVGQQREITQFSSIEASEMTGMRAPKLRLGGDSQFQMLSDNTLIYDSSIPVGPRAELKYENPYVWPFTLDNKLLNSKICRNEACPTKAYPGLWEVPVSQLVGSRIRRPYLCTYLDDCLAEYRNSSQVSKLLSRHFQYSYNGNRAPLQINLRQRTMGNKIAVDGITDFLKYVETIEDAWILTIQESLTWVKNPTRQSVIMDQGFWDCPRRKFVKCSEKAGSNSTDTATTYRAIIDVDTIWIWQTVLFIVLYIVVYRYDKEVHNKKKKK